MTNRALQVEFKIAPESHHINHAISKINIKLKYPELGFEIRYNNQILKEIASICVKSMNQYKFKSQVIFSARFDEEKEDNQVLDETEIFINLNINHNLTEFNSVNIDIKSPLVHQIQIQEMKKSGWRFDKIISMTIYFHKTGEMNGRS